MSAADTRVAVLSELPTPYRWPLFRRVAAIAGLDVTVLFYSRTEADRDWAVPVTEGPGTTPGSPPESPKVEFLPGRTIHVRRKRSLFFHWNPGIGARLAGGGFDVVVIPGWGMPTSLAAISHCRRRRVPYVLFSETHDRSRRPGWLRRVKRLGLRPLVGGASAWLATGSLSEQFLVRHGARAERVFRFANTPDVEDLAARVDAERPRRDEVRHELGIPVAASVAVFVGRLIGAKDPSTLLEAHARLEAHGRLEASGGWLLFVGDGTEAEALRDAAESRGLEQVVFAGARPPAELPAILAAADVFVLPSIHEPWGVVVNEAMAAGLPLILSDRVGASADLLEEGRNGLLFGAGDAAALTRALARLHANGAERRRMGEESRRIVADWGYSPSVDGFERAVRAAAGARP